MFYSALSKVSWKWAASCWMGYFYRDLKRAVTFSGVPLPTVSPRET